MNNLKEKYILHVQGYWQKNTSYLEDANGSGSIDETYELELNETVSPFGYNVKIVKRCKNYVELLINDKKVKLKENDRYYIVHKDETSGKNDDFKVDKESLYIELINASFYYSPYLKDYKDVRNKINKDIKKIESILDNKSNYIEVYYYLKDLLDSKKLSFFNKIKVQRIIKNIDIYLNENNRLLDALTKKDILISKDFKYIVHYLYQLVELNNYYNHIPFDKISTLCTNYYVAKGNMQLSKQEKMEYCYLLMSINAKGRLYFENFYIANFLSTYLLDEENFDYKKLVSFNIALGDYYLKMHNRPKARTHYLKASEILKLNNELKEASYIFAKYIKVNNTFPLHLKDKLDIDNIKKEYKEHIDIINEALNDEPNEVLEVEFTPVFIDNYFLVMRYVEKNMDKDEFDNNHIKRNELMKEYYKEEYNIEW